MALEALICPQCSGEVELDKDQEYGFCKYCGTKVQNTNFSKVKIKGKVQVDNAEYVEKFLLNARRAKSKEDWEEAEKYYNLVEQNEPFNIEAIFYSSYAKAKRHLIDDNMFTRQEAFKVLCNSVSIIDDNYHIDNDQNMIIVGQISTDINNLYFSNFLYFSNYVYTVYVYTVRRNQYGFVIYNNKYDTINLFNQVEASFIFSLEHIASMYDDSKKLEKKYFYELALYHVEFILLNGSLSDVSGWQQLAAQYHQILHMLDDNHQMPAYIMTDSTGCAKTLFYFFLTILILLPFIIYLVNQG